MSTHRATVLEHFGTPPGPKFCLLFPKNAEARRMLGIKHSEEEAQNMSQAERDDKAQRMQRCERNRVSNKIFRGAEGGPALCFASSSTSSRAEVGSMLRDDRIAPPASRALPTSGVRTLTMGDGPQAAVFKTKYSAEKVASNEPVTLRDVM
ncbi:hypothetical protein B0T26DRAFT_754504 [Lasiosphaeria miniovina]|uniref:Uncharacterized protein n=1 Tax=Lasiosphaeria miniovina TaxID=1954250 RepID=A0AA40A4N5_9PEZI|nr:uncharacterized protein B0T26DRAFT_754504 [Lasiosphaeria miniovina]KAK0709268.1 hypothetical protein B0T26DRAFT_754504 [Lasiosphaeria miniovina]